MNNWNHKKAITIISFIAAIGGLITILGPVFIHDDYQDGFPLWRKIAFASLQNVYLNYFNRETLLLWVGDTTRTPINLADLCFHFVFLLGAIVFVFNGFSNVRMIGFCFSVVFFIQCAELPMGMYNVIRRYELLLQSEQLWWTILYFISNFVWLWLSYYVLKTIGRNRSLSVESFEEDGVQRAFFNPAEKGQRFLHMIIDRVMIILICSTWLWIFADSVQVMNNKVASEWMIILVYVLCILIYYTFFEAVLGATPAKFLTATRVADEFGNKPAFGKVLLRTISRFVPFDAWSFFGNRGWHDNWSDTYVLNDAIATDETRFSFEETKDAEPVRV